MYSTEAGRRDHSRPLPGVVREACTTYLALLLFCSQLRKDAFDGGEKWIGSHTFIKIIICYKTTLGLPRFKFLELTFLGTPMEWKQTLNT